MNLKPALAIKDKEIAESGLAVYSDREISEIRKLPEFRIGQVMPLVQAVKESFGSLAIVLRVGEELDRGEDARAFLAARRKDKEDQAPTPEKKPKKRVIKRVTEKQRIQWAKDNIGDLWDK